MKIAVLVSGGVDSALALRLLKEQGHDVTAFYLKIWLEQELSFLGKCPWQEDLSYVEALCDKLNVPLKVLSLQDEYWKQVVGYTIEQVKSGKTPNPDMLCNQRIKFGVFYDQIDKSYEKVATGHYAQVEKGSLGYVLKRTNDPVKDQTYFLAHLSQKQLSRALFPIGNLRKKEVRELAQKYDLPNKDRKDSQGICFLGQIKFKEFIRHYLGVKFGDIVEFETGKKLGQHEGFWYYTIGQRKGLSLSGGPWYVVSKDVEKNIVYVSNKYHEVDKKRDRFNVSQFSWVSGGRPKKRELDIKIRHGEVSYKGVLDIGGDGVGCVTIAVQDQGIAPGQFAVFYDKNFCLGCGVIEVA
jgi:tRNA-specific 2-thiouridylase